MNKLPEEAAFSPQGVASGFEEIAMNKDDVVMTDKTLVERLLECPNIEHARIVAPDQRVPECVVPIALRDELVAYTKVLQARVDVMEAEKTRLSKAVQNMAEAVAIWAEKPSQETRQRNPLDQASWDQIAAVVGEMADAALEGKTNG